MCFAVFTAVVIIYNSMKNSNALIIIAKYPANGSVKTRLKSHMPDKKILELYTHLLETTIRKLRSIDGVDTFIAFAPQESSSFFSRYKLELLSLPEGDLGARMFSAFETIFKKGYENAVLVGADIPALDSNNILDALRSLSSHDLVFGPAEDGGYYLIGMNKFIKEVFENIPWSSSQTLKISLQQADRYGFSTGIIETLSDIDTIDDVKKAGLLHE
jgi:rSAM/selenodomain-associated transferase 1